MFSRDKKQRFQWIKTIPPIFPICLITELNSVIKALAKASRMEDDAVVIHPAATKRK